jgi:DNA invertase Pin-like site-specific DNA recombinase
MSAERKTIAVGYIRVASGSARKRERSVFLQRQAIIRYAKISDIQIVRFFADHAGISDIHMRQGLSDALESIASGRANGLMVAEVRSLTNSVEDLLRFIDRQRFLKDGPALVSVAEKLDTRTAAGRLMLGAVDVLAHWELRAMAGEVQHVES